MNRIIPWNLPVRTNSLRSLELIKLETQLDVLSLVLLEENTRDVWRLDFYALQAFRYIAEERNTWIANQIHDMTLVQASIGDYSLTETGGTFEVLDSEWVETLCDYEKNVLDKSHHYVVFCYDQVIEVVAWSYHIARTNQEDASPG